MTLSYVCLQNSFELGVRVPLLIRVPWLPDSIGKTTPALAEAVDLFQTFIDLSGLGEAVALPEDQVLQGTSLLPVVRDPPATGTGPRQYAFSQFAKSLTHSQELGKLVPWDTCDKCAKTNLFTNTSDPNPLTKSAIDYMGFSVRSERWRLTQWVRWDPTTLSPLWNHSAEFSAFELYDHQNDFGRSMDAATARVNLAEKPQYKAVVGQLGAVLRSQFRGDHEPPQ